MIAECALSLIFGSRLIYNGYQPVGMTGNWFFQSIDLFALAVATWLLYQIFVQKRVASSVENVDTCPIPVLIGVCFLLGCA